MSHESAMQPECIDSAVLTPLVRQALCSETVEVTDWDTQQIHGSAAYGSAGGSAIHRISGQGSDQGEEVEWSLILKVLYPPADPGRPSDWDYWRREADAFRSGLLDDLPGELAAPRCFGVVEWPSGECWILLEEVEEDIGPKWPLEHYGVVARHLGQFSGAYLTERPLPSYPWLSKRWIRDEIDHNVPFVAQLTNSLEHPLVHRALSTELCHLSQPITCCTGGQNVRGCWMLSITCPRHCATMMPSAETCLQGARTMVRGKPWPSIGLG